MINVFWLLPGNNSIKTGNFSRLCNPDSLAIFCLAVELSCMEPDNPIGDLYSSSINERRPFKIVLNRFQMYLTVNGQLAVLTCSRKYETLANIPNWIP